MLTVKSSTAPVSSRTNSSPFRVVCYSVIPSPYQRDLFYELSHLPEIDLSVFYWEASVSDSPWPEKALQPYEQIMPGKVLSWGSSRFHFNWHLPKPQEADVVILNGYMNSVVQLILHRYAKKVPCIFWGERLVDSGGIKGYFQRLFAKGLDNCKAIVAIGSKAEQDYQARFPNKPVFNIPYYCNLEEFKPMAIHYIPPVTILFCGQMIHRKGVDLLLQAFSRLIKQGYTARLLLVGREAELPKMLSGLPQSVLQQIEFAGFQPPENLPRFFQQADIFVLPSRYDGWGVVVNQALGAGLPIICSDSVGSADELVDVGINGHIFPTGNAQALFAALHSYIDSPKTIQKAAEASLRKSSDWMPSVGAKRWLNAVKSVATKNTYAAKQS